MAEKQLESVTGARQVASFEKPVGTVGAPWAARPATSTAWDHKDSEQTSVSTQAEQLFSQTLETLSSKPGPEQFVQH
jgi:hypothetical protein